MRIPVITMIILTLFSLGVDLYIWNDIRRFCRSSRKKLWERLYAGASIALWIFLIVVLSLRRRSETSSILPVMWMLYAYLTVYGSKFIYLVCSAIGRLFCGKKRKDRYRKNYGIYIGLPLGLLCFVVMWWGTLFTRYEIEVNKVTIASEKIPESFNNYRIVQFSDAHVGTWGRDTAFVSAVVDTIQSLKPDMIVFTGDIVNRQTEELEPFLKTLSRLSARDGVYSVLGNHDYGDYIDWEKPSDRDANNQLMWAWQNQIGWKLLNNQHSFITNGNDTIVLIGVENWGEPPFHQYGKLNEAYSDDENKEYNLNDEKFKILLSHNPEHWNREVTKTTNVDLTLSGHTHAMQAMIGSQKGFRWSPSQYRYEQWGGLYERNNPDGYPMRLYVNIGCGEVGMPARLGTAYPEITLIELKHK